MLAILQRLATLSHIDVELEEMREELGDLPLEVEELEEDVREKSRRLEEVQQQLKEILAFRTDGRISIEELEERSKSLTEKQFNVRNNREFDAITKELEGIKKQQDQIDRELNSSNVKEENYRAIIGEHEEIVKEAQERLAAKEGELAELSDDQNDEMTTLLKRKSDLKNVVPEDLMINYERIREYHKDVVVPLHKGSCSGCYNFVPPQKIVEMRKYEQMFTCENCGRILYPEDMEVPQDISVNP